MWEFWIDVGGTFTDCIGRSPNGDLTTFKTLSSGTTKGRADALAGRAVTDALRVGDPPGLWTDYELRFVDESGATIATTRVTDFDTETGTLLTADAAGDAVRVGTGYELVSGEEAPIVAIRRILGLRLSDPIPPLTLKLGTTRGTNALLERKGARTAFVTTKGFGDALHIGNQDRPRLFDLAITKPQPLFERVVEIDERLDAEGHVLQAPDETVVREQLRDLHTDGIASIGICLLHAYRNGDHERLVERIARDVGFDEVSVSSALTPLIKLVSRGDTTVMDAYLNPILRDYVRRLRGSLGSSASSSSERGVRSAEFPETESSFHSALRTPHSALKVMTSAGGLVDADRFVGKDSVLSGPAGGVIGFSRVAERAGFGQAIGFDMGGTSTDVARYDGTYEREFETTKAGVRVVAPMLAIETVAAGGGSVCGFDGVKLFVGPESAGADPGPTCYGRGGPLSVTDVNLFLGRILPSRFPFPLDRGAVERRLHELCDAIADSPLGTRYTPIELAEGFVRIANENMVRAVRRISVARGYDPADHVLVTFGGAGAQHACAIAESLGMRAILIHRFAGILSAYGIGLADVRRFGERAVLAEYDCETTNLLEETFRELEAATVAEIRAENVPEERVQPPVRSLDLRYRGVDATINVTQPDDGDYAARFAELHRRLYGYVHDDRPLEIVNARIEVVGAMPELEEPTQPVTSRTPSPHETTRAWFGGREHETAVFLRDDLQPGDTINGPSIVCDATSTIVIEPEWRAAVTERGEVLLEVWSAEVEVRNSERGEVRSAECGVRNEEALVSDVRGTEYEVPSTETEPIPEIPHSELRTPHSTTLNSQPSTLNSPDPVLLEVFNNLFASIAEQMGLVLQRTSFSTNVKERLDFSCAVFDPAGNLVVNAPHIPVHLGAMGETVKAVLADNPDMRPGDVFVTNDPYRGGSHLPDVTVVTPVFGEVEGRGSRVEGDEVQADALASAWRADPPLFLVASRAHHAEIGGIVPGSMPPFSRNLAEEGVLIRNFRLVDGGESREGALRELLLTGPFPTRNVHDNLADVAAQVAANNDGVRQLRDLVMRYTLPVVQAYMGHIQRAAAAKMQLALARFDDGRYEFTDHLDDGSPIRVVITIADETATVDFTGTGPVLATNLNANRAIVTAAVMYVFRCLIAEDIPLNAGVLEPVAIVLPECLLNPSPGGNPAQSPAVVGGNVETSQRVVDCLFGALGVAAASQGTMNNLVFGDQSFGYYETICGGSGATADADGADAVHTHMTNTRLTDAEVLERRYPVRVREFAIRRGSGGEGRRRGGDGIVRRIEFLKPLKVSMLSERRGEFTPFGLDDGRSGRTGRNTLRRAGTVEEIDLGGRFAIDVSTGDVLTIETPGGGGCGSVDPV